MGFIGFYSELISEMVSQIGYSSKKIEIVSSSRLDLGQFQINDAMSFAKIYKKSPFEIACEIVEKIKNIEGFLSLNVSSPGFINISFDDSVLLKYLNKIYNNNFSIENKKPKKILLDYGGPNIAKTLHVGHIRSANIGEALKRLCRSLGHFVLSDVHLGDWGLQIGMIIYEIKYRYPNLVFFSDNSQNFDNIDFDLTEDELRNLYPIASKKAKENEEVMQEIKSIVYKLQNKDKGLIALWRRILNFSLIKIKQNYKKINVDFEIWEGESDASEFIGDVISILDSKKMIQKSNGALVVVTNNSKDTEPMPPFIVKKEDGTFLYSTTELATIFSRIRKFDLDEIWYVVDNRQNLHFKQVFRVAKKSGIAENVKLNFIGFGTINNINGKPFKTREGEAMPLSLLIESIEKEVIKNINPDIKGIERQQLSQVISVAVLKCADLSSNISTDYIFDSVKFSKLNGKTGIYLLYSTLRIKSLLKKAENLNSDLNFKKIKINLITCDLIRKIILKILIFDKILKDAFEEKSLHRILEYLFEINTLYNNFYAKNKIISETDIDKYNCWIFVSICLYKINFKFLNILAIQVPDKI